MGIVIDLILAAILIVCIGMGYFKGLTGSILKIISFVLALIIAFVLFKPVANFVINQTNWDENLEQSIRQMIVEENEELEETEQKGEKETSQSMPTVITDYINEAVEQAGTDAKNAIVDATARNVAVTLINIIVWISLFFVSKIVLLLVKGLSNLLTKLPIIKQLDKVGGIIYGLIEGLIIIYLILAIVSFVSPMIADTSIVKGMQESYLGSMMYNNNLLLKLVF